MRFLKENFLSVVSLCLTYLLSVCNSQCSTRNTRDEFLSYIRAFSECQSKGGTVFEDEIQIINQVIDFDGVFNKDNFDAPLLSTYCSQVNECKEKISNCDSQLNDFVKAAGSALCKDAQPQEAIQGAIDTLSENPCVLYPEPTGLPPDGCLLANDNARPTTYLAGVQRKNKKDAAISRCMSRYTEEQGSCSSKVIAALATITAASLPLEKIGASFDSYTKYQTPTTELMSDQTTRSVRGFMHFYKDGSHVETCAGLEASNVLLWNTYLRVDGTGSELVPMSGRIILTSVFIQFFDKVGRVLDSYTTRISDGSLATQTLLQTANIKTETSSNLVVLSYSDIHTNVAVSMSGQGLSVIVSLPEEIVKLETLGILVEGCETFGANVIEDFEADVSDACRTSCSYDSPKLNSAYVDECAYDCTYGVTEYRETYYDIDDHIAIVRDDNAATSKAPSNILFALIPAVVFLMT